MEKQTVFPGGYGRIGEIPHWRLWPDWSLKGNDICIVFAGRRYPIKHKSA